MSDEHHKPGKTRAAAAKDEEHALRLALKGGGIGTWRHDPAQQCLQCDAGTRKLTGFPAELPLAELEDYLAPEDAEELRLALADACESHGQLVLDVHVGHNGTQRRVRMHAQLAQLDGQPLLLGTACDSSAELAFLEALRAENQRKDEFLGLLGHELRNPIGALASGIRLLQKGGRNEQELEWIRSMLAEQVAQTSRLLEEVLDASRIVRRKITLRRQPTPVGELVERAVARARVLVERRQHELALDVAAAAAVVAPLDGPRVEQALFHLLSNAARYTPTGGRVSLAIRIEAPLLVFEVVDNGIGFDPQQALRIFEPTTKAQPDGERPGLGLGLLFVREIVDLHGGRVELESAATGSGSVVRMVLPMAPEEAEGPALHALEGGMRVLVVDDNRESAQLLAVALEDAGCHVENAFDAAQALRLAKSRPPDVVLLDLGLPDLDGFVLAAELRADELLLNTRLIALSGFRHPEAARRIESSGFDGFLLKPVGLRELFSSVARA